MEIRIRETGQVVTEREFRNLQPQTSLPKQLTESLLDRLGADPVFEGPQVSGEFWQHSMRSGVEQINGKWYTKYVLGPVFETDEDRGAYVAQKQQEKYTATKLALTDAVQKRLDDFAATRNYMGILSACTYATSTVPTFAAEGQYCVGARDATWAKCYEILAGVEAGTTPMPSGFADIEPELPVLQWPGQ